MTATKVTRSALKFFKGGNPNDPINPQLMDGDSPSEPIGWDMTLGEVERTFAMVQNPGHWKGEIDSVVTDVPKEHIQKMCRNIRNAVYHFTATQASVKSVKGKIRVKALGYWKGPAN